VGKVDKEEVAVSISKENYLRILKWAFYSLGIIWKHVFYSLGIIFINFITLIFGLAELLGLNTNEFNSLLLLL
jgi:hypothetical protein